MTELVPAMFPVDTSRLWVVAVPVVTVYVLAASTVIRWIAGRGTWGQAGRGSFADARPPVEAGMPVDPGKQDGTAAAQPAAVKSTRWSWGRVLSLLVRVNLVLAGLGIACAAYSFVEPYRVEVTRTAVPCDKLPAGSRSIRIVQLSDVHSDDKARLEDDIPELVADLRPDVIVFTGDAVNQDAGLPHFRRLMKALAGIAPTFVVRGNWEVWWFRHLELFEDTGVIELYGRAVPLQVGGVRLWFVGAPVDGHHLLWPALAGVPAGEPVIAVHHYPEVGAEALRRGADIALSGDTHGGQLRLPLLGALIRMARYGTYYDIGLHRIGHGFLYVHRGVGMEGGVAPRVRFLCRPEVALLELMPTGK